jgi:hypothetical protein
MGTPTTRRTGAGRAGSTTTPEVTPAGWWARASGAVGHAVVLALASLVSYRLTTRLLALQPSVGHENDVLGGMWAVIATVFVLRLGCAASLEAARSRAVSTVVSFVLCLAWLLVLPAGVAGLVVVLGVGTALLLLLGRPDDVVTTGVTTAVVMVVAALGPPDRAWVQPPLRLLDTAIGVVVGLVSAWLLQRLNPRAAART